jgi:hypothetical protein
VGEYLSMDGINGIILATYIWPGFKTERNWPALNSKGEYS